MIAQTVSTSTVFFFSLDELQDTGLTPDALTDEQVLFLLRSICVFSDLPLPDFPEIQLFCTQSGVLLFLRPLPSHTSLLAFSGCIFS